MRVCVCSLYFPKLNSTCNKLWSLFVSFLILYVHSNISMSKCFYENAFQTFQKKHYKIFSLGKFAIYLLIVLISVCVKMSMIDENSKIHCKTMLPNWMEFLPKKFFFNNWKIFATSKAVKQIFWKRLINILPLESLGNVFDFILKAKLYLNQCGMWPYPLRFSNKLLANRIEILSLTNRLWNESNFFPNFGSEKVDTVIVFKIEWKNKNFIKKFTKSLFIRTQKNVGKKNIYIFC